MDDNRAELREFGRAVEALLNGRPRGWLGAEVARIIDDTRAPFTASAVTQWIDGETEPTRDKVFAIEAALKVAPGTLSRILGYLPVTAVAARSVPDAIRADRTLPEEARGLLLKVYETFLNNSSGSSGPTMASTAKTRKR